MILRKSIVAVAPVMALVFASVACAGDEQANEADSLNQSNISQSNQIEDAEGGNVSYGTHQQNTATAGAGSNVRQGNQIAGGNATQNVDQDT